MQLADSTTVDVALLDLNMPGLNGVEAASRISLRQPEVAVLMLTMFEDDASVFAALRAGARGYVLKDSSRDELLRAIRAVASGEAIFSPSVASRVLDFFTHATLRWRPTTSRCSRLASVTCCTSSPRDARTRRSRRSAD